jgi:hypothetical protein
MIVSSRLTRHSALIQASYPPLRMAFVTAVIYCSLATELAVLVIHLLLQAIGGAR